MVRINLVNECKLSAQCLANSKPSYLTANHHHHHSPEFSRVISTLCPPLFHHSLCNIQKTGFCQTTKIALIMVTRDFLIE